MPSRTLWSSKPPVPSLTYSVLPLRDELGDEQVLVAVVVEVAGIDAHVGLALPEPSERRAGDAAPCFVERAVAAG